MHKRIRRPLLLVSALAFASAAAWVAFSLADLALPVGADGVSVDDAPASAPEAEEGSSLPYAAFEGEDSTVTGGSALEVTALVDFDGDGVFSMSERGSAHEAVWKYSVTNTGNVRLEDVGLVDSLHASGGYDNVLDPGKSMTWEITLPVTGSLENRAQVTARTSDGTWLEPVWVTTSVTVID